MLRTYENSPDLSTRDPWATIKMSTISVFFFFLAGCQEGGKEKETEFDFKEPFIASVGSVHTSSCGDKRIPKALVLVQEVN